MGFIICRFGYLLMLLSHDRMFASVHRRMGTHRILKLKCTFCIRYARQPTRQNWTFLLVGVSRVFQVAWCAGSQKLICLVGVVFVVFLVIKHVWYCLVPSRRLVCGGSSEKLQTTENYRKLAKT